MGSGRGGPASVLPGDLSDSVQVVAVARARDAVMVAVSDGFCLLVGRRREEIVGHSAAELGISDRGRLDWLIDRFPEPGQSHHQRRVFVTPQGRRVAEMDIHGVELFGERMIISVINPLAVDEGDGEAGVLGAVLEAIPLGVVVYDRELRIVRVNRAVERLGRISARHIGQRIGDAVADVDDRIVDAITHVFATGEAVVGMDGSGANGRSYLVTVFPITDRSDQVDRVGCVFLDVTDRVSTERALAESERHRREILASMLQAEEGERSRIATELHDDTVQVMTAALLSMDRVAMVARKGGHADLESALVLARGTLEEATDRARRLMFELRPAVLHDHGLAAALTVLVDQTARETHASGEVWGGPGRYDHATEELIYRTVQEALANVRKHAHPNTITVTLQEHAGVLTGEIQDDGQGFDIVEAKTRPGAMLHLGLDSMVERIRAAGGDITIDSTPGHGTRVWFAIPHTADHAYSSAR